MSDPAFSGDIKERKKMKKQLFPTNHDYYAHSSNYCCKDCAGEYANWQSFYEEYKDADIDMNLVFRWDIKERDPEKPGIYYMQVIIIAQRKGIYVPIQINSVLKSDEKSIMEFMKPHFDKIISNWQPFSDKFLNP